MPGIIIFSKGFPRQITVEESRVTDDRLFNRFGDRIVVALRSRPPCLVVYRQDMGPQEGRIAIIESGKSLSGEELQLINVERISFTKRESEA